MRRLIALSASIVMAACGAPSRPPAPPVHEPAQKHGLLADLAREIDPGAQPPIWPQVPADVRGKTELLAPQDRTQAARLAGARERLGDWSLHVSTDLDPVLVDLERVYTGVYLAEPLALSTVIDASTLEARFLLWRFYRAFKMVLPLLQAVASGSKAAAAKLERSIEVAALFQGAGAKMADRFAADILRAGAPETAVTDIVWAQAWERFERGDAASGRALAGEYIRRSKASTSIEDRIRIAEAHVRLDDVRASAEAAAQARAATPPTDRRSLARIRDVERDRELVVRLLALPADTSAPTSFSRFDLLMDLNRPKAAEAVLAPLLRERPNDARVRARSVRLRVRNGDFSERLVEELRPETLTDRDTSYWSMRVGAAGLAAARGPTRALLDEIEAANAEIAKEQPGRAAALRFITERVGRMMGSPADSKTIIASLGTMLDDALVLRTKYPSEPDVDRVVVAVSLFAEPAKGMAAAIVRPKASPEDEPDLYVERATTVVSLAAYLGTGADLRAVRAAVEDIAPSTDAANVEAEREALLGDVDALTAIHGDRAAWARSAAHYDTAKNLTRRDHARFDNNIAYAAAMSGDPARAKTLFDAASEQQSERRYVPLLNLATMPGLSREDRLAILRKMAGPPDADTPSLINVWRASLEPDAKEAALAAQRSITDLDTPIRRKRFDILGAEGVEPEGTFSLNLSVRAGHTLSARAYARLWLTAPSPLSLAELEAKSKAAPPRK